MKTQQQNQEAMIKGRLEDFLANYFLSINDQERARTDNTVRDFIKHICPNSFEYLWGYYQARKQYPTKSIPM